MADNAEVRLGANVDPLKRGMSEAEASARQTLRSIGEHLQRTASDARTSVADMQATLRGLRSGFGETERAARTAATGTSTAMDGMARSMRNVLATIGLGAAFRNGLQRVVQFEDGVEQLQRTLGVTADKAVNMSIALRLAGSSAQDFNTMGLTIGRALRTQSDEFARLGVTVKDANGNLLPMEQIMRNTYTRMLDFKEGTDQTEFALALTGRSAKEFGDTMENLERVQTRATELQRQFGLTMDEGEQAKIKAYKTEVGALQVALDAAAISMGQRAMPALQNLARFFIDIGPGAIKIMEIAINSIITVFHVLGATAATVAIGITGAFTSISEAIGIVGRAFMAVVRGEWGSIPGIIMDGNNRIRAHALVTADSVKATWSRAATSIADTWAAKTAGVGAPGGKSGSGNLNFTPRPKGGSKGGDESRMAEWEAMLKEQRDAYERMKLDQGSFERWSEAQTSAFWQNIINTVNLSTKEYAQVVSRFYDAERQVRQKAFDAEIADLEAQKQAIRYNYDERIRLAQEVARRIAQAYGMGSKEAIAAEARVTQEVARQAEQRMRIADVERRAIQARAEHEASMESMVIGQKVALRQMNVQQALQQEAALQNRLYAIKADALRKEIDLEAQGPNDPVKMAQMHAQLEGLEMEHQRRMTEIAQRAEQDRMQAAIEAANAVQDAFGNLINDLISGTKSWKDAFRDAAKNITAELNRIASQQIAKQLFGAGTAGGGFLNDIFGKIFGGGVAGGGNGPLAAAGTTLTTAGTTLTTAATQLLTAAGQLMASAMGGGGGGMGSLFGSLFGGGGGGSIGDFGLGTALAGYAVGTPYVPQDSLAVVHKGEAIIPARYNNTANRSLNMGGLHLTINTGGAPVDTRTQYQIQEGVAKAVRTAGARAGA